MAYRRRQGSAGRASATFEDFRSTAAPPSAGDDNFLPALVTNQSSSSALAAQAIRASAAHRDSSLSSAYGDSAFAAARDSSRQRSTSSPRDPASYEYTSMKNLSDSKYSGFWGVLARKAKTILEDDNATKQSDSPGRNQHRAFNTVTGGQFHPSYGTPESNRKTETPPFHRSSEAIASSLNFIGGTIKNALEEGFTIVEHKTADIIHETRKLNIRRKGSDPNNAESQPAEKLSLHHFPQIQTDYETQLKASRDVANAMAAKAKLLLRELKTVKADLAFAKERCAQLEEENKMLRESREKGDTPEDDDLIRLQLETLLAEKARLAQENSVYARENRFLREIVEYHQLTMQDVVYVDEGIEEVTEVSPIRIPTGTSLAAVSEPPSPPLTAPPTPTASGSATNQQPHEASPSIVLTESLPLAPTAPEHLPQAATPNARASTPPLLAGEDAR